MGTTPRPPAAVVIEVCPIRIPVEHLVDESPIESRCHVDGPWKREGDVDLDGLHEKKDTGKDRKPHHVQR